MAALSLRTQLPTWLHNTSQASNYSTCNVTSGEKKCSIILRYVIALKQMNLTLNRNPPGVQATPTKLSSVCTLVASVVVARLWSEFARSNDNCLRRTESLFLYDGLNIIE